MKEKRKEKYKKLIAVTINFSEIKYKTVYPYALFTVNIRFREEK